MLDKLKQTVARERGITEDQIEAFTLRLERFLANHLDEIIGGLRGGSSQATAAAKALLGIEVALSELGLDDLLDDLTDIYGDKLNYISHKFDTVAGAAVVYNEVDLDSLHALIQFDIEAVKLKTYETIAELRSAVMRTVIIGENPRKIWRDHVGKLQMSLDTELNTAVAGFERTVTIAKADEHDLKLFLYSGPEDDKNRTFCSDRVGRVFHRDEVDDWQEEQGQDLPVEQYLGGYNCRHQMLFIDPIEALDYPRSDKAQEYLDGLQNLN